MEEQIIKCPNCNKEFKKKDLKRNCSNCFACTGCEVYICYNCDERIEIIAPREFKRKKSQDA